MASVPEKVLNWLYSVLTSEYADVNRTYHDAAEALSHYPSLSPRTEIYTFENGASALLLRLAGTLPVTFRGATYGFPVAIWVPHSYPREPPMVYITPSPDMVVRPGQHVSGDGRVYHPYLAQWGKYWDKSTLFDFLAVLRGVFAKEPPVRSKQQQPQHQALTQQAAPPPLPPPPAEWRRSAAGMSVPSQSPGPSNQPPAPPPKPPKPGEPTRATPQPQSSRYSHPPPLPPHPPQQSVQQQQYRPPPAATHGPPANWQHQQQRPVSQHAPNPHGNYDVSPTTPSNQRPRVQPSGYSSHPYGPGSPISPITPDRQRAAAPYPPPHQQPMAGHQIQQQYYHQAPPQQQSHVQQPPSHQPYQQQPQNYPQQSGHPPQQHPSSQHQFPPRQAPAAPKPPVDLLDDSLQVTIPSQHGNQVPLPVPPVPPNPEKDALLRALSQALCSQIRQTVSSNQSAIQPLHAQQIALQSAYGRLQAESRELQELESVLEANEKVLVGAMRDVDRVIQESKGRGAPEVDDVLVAPTVVGGQLYGVASEERALADALFVLGRALDKGRVGTDTFVKQTRSLAREQFLKKALLKKISKGMGLDEFQMR